MGHVRVRRPEKVSARDDARRDQGQLCRALLWLQIHLGPAQTDQEESAVRDDEAALPEGGQGSWKGDT